MRFGHVCGTKVGECSHGHATLRDGVCMDTVTARLEREALPEHSGCVGPFQLTYQAAASAI